MHDTTILSFDSVFLIKVLLSFVVGSTWITLLSLFSERLGAKVGGAVAGIPTTMVVSLAFIGMSQSATVAVAATTIIPLVLGINVVMVTVFLAIVRTTPRKFWLAFGVALGCWFVLAYGVSHSITPTLPVSLVVYALVISLGYYLIEHQLTIPSVVGKAGTRTKAQVAFRAVIAGTVVCGAVLAARFSGPTIGGVFATFPALTVALMLIFKMSGSVQLLPSFLKNFIVVGTLNVCAFVLSVRYTFAVYSVLWGTLISLSVSLATSYILYRLVNKKMK
jgi:hypothetical protein